MKSSALTLEDIQNQVKSVTFQKVGEKTTVCFVTLQNDYEIVTSSASVRPGDYSKELGEKIAYNKAIDRIWELEGYLLQQRLHEN
jgi:hypothetical protein